MTFHFLALQFTKLHAHGVIGLTLPIRKT